MLFWILLTETLNAVKLLKIHRKATETMITLKTWQGASHIYIVQKAIRLMGKWLSKKLLKGISHVTISRLVRYEKERMGLNYSCTNFG